MRIISRLLIMLLIITIVSVFIPVSESNAMVPAVPLVGALTKETVVLGVIASMNMISLAVKGPDIIDDLTSIVDLNDVSLGWYIHNGLLNYGISVPVLTQDAIYWAIINNLGGYGVSTLPSDTLNYIHGSAILDGMIYSGAMPSHYIGQLVNNDPNRIYMCLFYPSINEFRYLSPPSIEYDSYLDGKLYFRLPFRTYVINDDATSWAINGDGLRSLSIDDSSGKLVYSNTPIPLPDGEFSEPAPGVDIEDIWDSQYNTSQGINYNTWVAQPSGKYFINIPTTENELGQVVVDDVALRQQSTDIARVDEYVVEYNKEVVTPVPDPYVPEVPVTDPITDPVTDVQSDTWLDRLWSKFVNLFVLPDNYFIDNFTKLQSDVPMLAFPNQIIADMGNFAKIGPGVLNDITVTMQGKTSTIVSFQSLRDSLPVVHNWVRAVMFVLLLLYNYNQVYRLINGGAYGFSPHITGQSAPETRLEVYKK